ncbi:MAG: PilZ domain-containing protein [Kangiellaceae bacterium]|nr:PilZ domain-containing protein [Kangiellaceae bacterium]
MSNDLDDLRRERRKFSERAVKVRFIDKTSDNTAKIFRCCSQDISAGGLKLVSQSPLALGLEVPMEIDLGEMWAVIEVVAQVKWCLEVDDLPTYFIGIKLVDIQQSNFQVWKKFVANL